MLRYLLLALIVGLFGFGVVMGYGNAAPVHVNYLFGGADVSLIVLLLLVFLAGVALTLLICGAKYFAMLADLRRVRRQLRDVETELRNLRALPLQASGKV